MKIFLDTADVAGIREAAKSGLIGGVTTNPSHIMNSGRKFKEVVKEICDIIPGPVSAEAMGDTAAELVEDARKIAALAPNVYIKIPMTVEGVKAVPILERDHGIHTNVTMVFSAAQTMLAMKAGATFVSLVLSRLDNIGIESTTLVDDAVTIKANYGFPSEVLAASIKTQNQVLDCMRAGVDIISIPVDVFSQMYKHALTDAGLAQFAKDWQKVPQ